MTLRRAGPGDIPALTAFLRRHEAQSLFPLANLASGGLDGPGPHGMRGWVAGRPEGFAGLTRAGMVLPQWPGAADWVALRRPLAGCDLTGVLGPADQVRPLIGALGLHDAPRRHDADEPGLALDLAGLPVPEGDGDLIGLAAAPPGLVEDWRAGYLTEIFATPPGEAALTALSDVARWRQADSHRLLWQGGQPVALCGLNAALPEVVQVGGVYVPPPLRGRGHARQAVARLLHGARARGVLRAVLFAASDVAAGAYRAIGFRPAGRMGLVLFEGPQRVPAWV